MKNKKMIYILNHYSKKSVEHFYHVINLLEMIADKGVEIVLIIEKSDGYPDIDNPNIRIICQKEEKIFLRYKELFSILKYLIKEGYSKIFIRITINAAIVAILVSKIYNAETYYWQSGTTHKIKNLESIYSKIKFYLYSNIRFWFVKTYISHFVSGPETMVDYYIDTVKVKKEKMMLLYNDIDINRFSPISLNEKERIKEQMGLEKDSKIILMVHRLSPVRKSDMYIPLIIEDEKLNQNNAYLIIIGEGPERKMLEKNTEKSSFNKRVIFLGSKPNHEIEAYYNIADIFINPSYTEGFPRVIIEAMACGLPVVATNAGGTIDIMGKNQKEFITDKDYPEQLRQKLFQLLVDNKLQKKLSIENINQVKKFSTESVSDMYIERIFN